MAVAIQQLANRKVSTMFLKSLETQAVKDAVTSSHIRVVAKVVTVTAKALKAQGITPDAVKAAGLALDKDGNLVRSVSIPEALNVQGMAALCNGKIEPAKEKPESGKDERTADDKAAGVCDIFNYAVDLDVRQEIRQAIMASLESPDKAIKRGIDTLLAIGMDLETATGIIVGQMVKSGRVSADYVYAAAVAA